MTTKNQPQLDVPQLVLEAHERCQEHLSPTPLEYSRYLSEKIEGSGALSVGGLLKRKEHFKGKKVVAVVCGRNIPLELFKRIIA